MNVVEMKRELARQGMNLVEAAVDTDPFSFADSPTEARTLKTLAMLFFGPCRHPRKQRDAVAAAKKNGHSLSVLSMIKRLAKGDWHLILRLCRMNAGYKEIAAAARKAQPSSPPTQNVRITSNHTNGTKTLHLTAEQHVIAGINATLPKDDKAAALIHRMTNGGHGLPTVVTNTIIGLDEHCRIVGGEGDEILIASTDGSIMTGKDYVERIHADYGITHLVHPMEGVVNAYRHKRLANPKQRLMAAVENPICPWPDCATPADECQVHHLVDFQHGGQTNPVEMSMACGYHNGVNGHRGTLARINGEIWWRPPGNGPPRRNLHPANELGAVQVAKRAARSGAGGARGNRA